MRRAERSSKIRLDRSQIVCRVPALIGCSGADMCGRRRHGGEACTTEHGPTIEPRGGRADKAEECGARERRPGRRRSHIIPKGANMWLPPARSSRRSFVYIHARRMIATTVRFNCSLRQDPSSRFLISCSRRQAGDAVGPRRSGRILTRAGETLRLFRQTSVAPRDRN